MRSRELGSAFTEDDMATNVLEKALSIVIHALGDNLLRTIPGLENCQRGMGQNATKVCRKTMINKLSISNTLLNKNFTNGEDMGDDVVSIESQFSRLASIGSTINESMKVAILLSSLLVSNECSPVIASVNTMQEHLTTRNHVTMNFVEEQKRIAGHWTRNVNSQKNTSTVLASTSRM